MRSCISHAVRTGGQDGTVVEHESLMVAEENHPYGTQRNLLVGSQTPTIALGFSLVFICLILAGGQNSFS